MAKDSRPKRPITAARLQNYALWYLQKQFPSKNWLRQKTVQFATRKKPSEQMMQDILPMVDDLLVRLEKENIINDQRLAENLARQWSARLMPWRKIEMKLTAKGFERDTIAALKNSLEDNETMADEETMARDYAARKKLGRFRNVVIGNHNATDDRMDAVDDTTDAIDYSTDGSMDYSTESPTVAQKNYQKDLAKMARAGFSYAAAQRALKPED